MTILFIDNGKLAEKISIYDYALLRRSILSLLAFHAVPPSVCVSASDLLK